MVYQSQSIRFNYKARNNYRWVGGCRPFGFTTPCFEGRLSESDEESAVDSESEESDEDSEDDDDDEEEEDDEEDRDEEDEVVESERFLFLSTIHYCKV